MYSITCTYVQITDLECRPQNLMGPKRTIKEPMLYIKIQINQNKKKIKNVFLVQQMASCGATHK